MKEFGGWCFPDHEVHLIDWLKTSGKKLDGRLAYQHQKWSAALAYCRRFRTAVDVGAHIGTWSYYLAGRFTTIRAFEPVAEHRECFTFNVKAPNVITYPVALGAEPGFVGMHVSDKSSGDSWVDGDGDIPIETLDSFGFDDVDFLKVDCEGFEENVIRGGLETIRHSRPVVCVEQKRDMAVKFGLKKLGAVDLLRDNGYKVAAELSGDYILVP